MASMAVRYRPIHPNELESAFTSLAHSVAELGIMLENSNGEKDEYVIAALEAVQTVMKGLTETTSTYPLNS